MGKHYVDCHEAKASRSDNDLDSSNAFFRHCERGEVIHKTRHKDKTPSTKHKDKTTMDCHEVVPTSRNDANSGDGRDTMDCHATATALARNDRDNRNKPPRNDRMDCFSPKGLRNDENSGDRKAPSRNDAAESSQSAKMDSANENDLELFDMLCVALHFAGLKRSALRQILQAYSDELDSFDDEAQYGQREIISIIHTLRAKYPHAFHTQAKQGVDNGDR